MIIILLTVMGYSCFTSALTYQYWVLCSSTYEALKSGQYELEENFKGMRYFRHYMSNTRWYNTEDGRKSYICIFPDNGIKLLNANGIYLHSGPLPYLLSPILGYWRIKFNKLIKQLPEQPDRPDIDFIAKRIQEVTDQLIVEKIVESSKSGKK